MKYRELVAWLRGNYGKNCLAPLTSQDQAALAVCAYALQLYVAGDEDGVAAGRDAFRAAALAMQASTRWAAREALAWALQWESRELLWAQLGLDEVSPSVAGLDAKRESRQNRR